jgi:UDP:flavonoid glycosyltransferase YjiC (YdhE family)
MTDALLATWDGAGNLAPIRPLVRALVANGYTVRALAHDSVKAILERDGMEHRSVPGARYYSSMEPMAPEEEMPFVVENIWFGRPFGEALRAEIDRRRPDLLLVDISLTYALVAARASGIPTAVLGHFPYSLLLGPFGPLLDARLGQTNTYAGELGLAPFASHQAMVESAALVLVPSYRPFETVDTFAANVVHVGRCRAAHEQGTPWERRMPRKSLVLVGLSTSHQGQGPLLQRLCDALADLDVEALVTTGPAIAPENLRAGPNTTVVPFVPHDRVLPITDVLVTHAGHGTVVAGMTYGVPMLCIPMGRDQPMNAERVVRLGVGVTTSPDADVSTLRSAIGDLVANEALAGRAKVFARSLANHPGLDHAVGLVERLVAR